MMLEANLYEYGFFAANLCTCGPDCQHDVVMDDLYKQVLHWYSVYGKTASEDHPMIQYLSDVYQDRPKPWDLDFLRILLEEAVSPISGVCNRLVCLRKGCDCPADQRLVPIGRDPYIVAAIVPLRKK